MRTAKTTVHTTLSPGAVVELLTDFGPERASRWPNIDDGHFEVHGQGTGWVEVTEGNRIGWERERYSWDPDAAGESRLVTIDTLESNLWAPGSGWRYEISAATDGGSDVQITLNRSAHSIRGKLIGALIPLLGARTIGGQFSSVLRRAEAA